jgi:hypothetical protein
MGVTQPVRIRGAVFLLITLIGLAVAASDGRAEDDAGFRDLFNGRDLDGWIVEGLPGSDRHDDGRPVWSVRDGEIVCDGKGFGFLRYDGEQFGDFTLHVEFLLSPRCNTGIGVRTRVFEATQSRLSRPSRHSYEIQLVDDAGQPPTTHSSGSLYRYVAPLVNATKPAGELNSLDVTCTGPRIRVVLNGRLLHDFDQNGLEETRNKPLSGHVCLQNHGGQARFRQVRIRHEAKPTVGKVDAE